MSETIDQKAERLAKLMSSMFDIEQFKEDLEKAGEQYKSTYCAELRRPTE